MHRTLFLNHRTKAVEQHVRVLALPIFPFLIFSSELLSYLRPHSPSSGKMLGTSISSAIAHLRA